MIGGISNIPFLLDNAKAVKFEATFWIETVEQPNSVEFPTFMHLQYSQTVMLEFGEIIWPHISVATLIKQ